jgi:hypothetical protein
MAIPTELSAIVPPQACVDDQMLQGLFRATVTRDYIFRELARQRRLRRTSRAAKFLS